MRTREEPRRLGLLAHLLLAGMVACSDAKTSTSADAAVPGADAALPLADAPVPVGDAAVPVADVASPLGDTAVPRRDTAVADADAARADTTGPSADVPMPRTDAAIVGVDAACTPESDATFCQRLARSCGQVSAADNCGPHRTVASCGSCTPPETCGGGGIENVCAKVLGATGVTVHLEKTFASAAPYASFGMPVPSGALADVSTLQVLPHGGTAPIAGINAKALLREHGADGKPTGVRAVLLQIPTSALGSSANVDVLWTGATTAPGSATVPFAQVSAASPETVDTAERTITKSGSTCSLVESSPATMTLFIGTEPSYLATFPDGYLASTGIIGKQVPRTQVGASADLAGVKYMSDNVTPFALSAMYQESYRINPDSVVDPVTEYEGWLYDRCTTFLSFHAHTGDARFLREAFRNCSYYASKIDAGGIFTGKPDPDSKYSHLRGLYAYYALTGDESALTAGRAIAAMWLADTSFVAPYRQGHLRGRDKLWTERLLGTSLEGLYYGHLLLDDAQYLAAFKQMLDTAYAHVTTTDQAALNKIDLQDGTASYPSFPAQNCFIHNAEQAAEGNGNDPWCSGWMTELLVDVLLAYQRQTGDARVDEIFVRLTRFLRDVGSCYFRGDPVDDRFLSPQICYDSTDGLEARQLVPLYGSGLYADGTRYGGGDWSDFEHCSDATALTAAALRALKRLGLYDAGGPLGPFATEGESFLQLFHEFSFCAQATFSSWTRMNRDPSTWSSSELCAGAADPATFIADNKIGHPCHPSSPQRKLSWWFNMSLLQFGLLQDAGIAVPSLHPGVVQPASCR
jgi:hypothetical protein